MANEPLDVTGLARESWSRRTLPMWVVFVVAALSAIFYLPKLVPMAPAISDSYLFGYSNRAGVMLLLGFLLIGGYFSRTLRIEFRQTASGNRIPRRLVWTWMGVFAAGGAVMYLLVRGLNGFGESIYLIDRVKMLAEGGRPYKDFEFIYGVLFLYGPKALMAMHLSVESSYFVFWLACVLTGVWMLCRVIEMLDYPSERSGEIFQLLCLFSLPSLLCTGLNYTLLRFIPAAFFGLLVQQASARGGRPGQLAAILLPPAFTIVLLTISPEIALAYAVGTLGYFALFGRRYSGRFAGYGLLLASEFGILLEANRLKVFATVKEFSKGAYSFPIVPAGHILFFFFSCGLVCFLVAARLRQGSQGDGMLMVVAVSAGTLYSGLSRCDVGHVGFAPLGILIVAMMAASTFPNLWRWYRPAFIVLFVVLPTASEVWSYKTLLSKVVFFRIFQSEPRESQTKLDSLIERGMKWELGEANARIKFKKLKDSSRGQDSDLEDMHPQLTGILQAPFGYAPAGFGTIHLPNLRLGYFSGLNNVFTPPTVDQKILELQSHPERKLILPDNFDDECAVDAAAERKLIKVLFMYPYTVAARHPESIRTPLCDYIHEHYTEMADIGPLSYGYRGWRAR